MQDGSLRFIACRAGRLVEICTALDGAEPGAAGMPLALDWGNRLRPGAPQLCSAHSDGGVKVELGAAPTHETSISHQLKLGRVRYARRR